MQEDRAMEIGEGFTHVTKFLLQHYVPNSLIFYQREARVSQLLLFDALQVIRLTKTLFKMFRVGQVCNELTIFNH